MNDEYWINIKTKRDVRLFLWRNGGNIAFLNYRLTKKSKKYNINHVYGDDSSLAALAINEAFQIQYESVDILNAFVYSFNKMKSMLLPLKEFSWFKRSNDACYFAWTYIRTLDNKNVTLTNNGLNEYCAVGVGTLYDQLIKIKYPVNHRERIECIEDFFDRSPMDLSSKLSLMFEIRNNWDRQSQLANRLPLKKNEKEKINWAWDYVCKDKISFIHGSIIREKEKLIKNSKTDKSINVTQMTLLGIESSGIEGHFHQPNFLRFFRPSTTTEKYLALRCIYIFMYHNNRVFIVKFKKAWEQLSYRKSKKKNKNGRKPSDIKELKMAQSHSEAITMPELEILKSEKDMNRVEPCIMTEEIERKDRKKDDNDPEYPRFGPLDYF